MKKSTLDIVVKILIYWYIFIFFSTEILSYLHLIERNYILLLEVFFWAFFLFFYRQEILQSFQKIGFRSKSTLLILLLFLLTFVQGFFSAPNTTDSMVYHLPRIMYWIQEDTLYQNVIRNTHDYMAPFGEYILLHLYLICGNDRMLFFSQWIAYIGSIYLIGKIALQLGVGYKISQLIRLFIATLPITVMQSTSTQVDMVVTVLSLLSLHLVFLLKKAFSVKAGVLLGMSLGLGLLTKATFIFYFIIAIGIFFLPFKNTFKKTVIILPVLFLVLILQLRFMFQNYQLYGNFLGVDISEKGEKASYINEAITPFSIISNVVRNFFVHMPVPIFSSFLQNRVASLHDLMGLNMNDPRITCCNTKFSVQPVLYPQEDIAANPLQLIIIMIAGGFLIYKRKQLKGISQVKVLYLLTILSFILFSALIKWQPFHPRLEIPIFIVGSTCAIIILYFARQLRFLYMTAVLTSMLALVFILLNVSRPFFSYGLFYSQVKPFKPVLASVPEAFYIKPRQQQYFNARNYWYKPYLAMVNLLKNDNSTEVAFKLDDGFEYPFWLLMKENSINKKVIPYLLKDESTAIISTSEKPFANTSYLTKCVKTTVEYGYACFSKRN